MTLDQAEDAHAEDLVRLDRHVRHLLYMSILHRNCGA